MAEETNDLNPADETTDNLPENKVDIEDAGTLKKKITVTIPRERIDAKYDEMFGELSDNAQIPGFRVGRAPRRLLEKRFGKEVTQDVRNALVGEAIGSVMEDEDLNTIGEPELELDEIEVPDSGEMEISFEIEVAPEFDLPELEGIEVEKPEEEVSDEKVDEYIEQMMQSMAKFVDSDKPAGEGDMVVAAAKLTSDELEKPIERPGLSLRVAPGQIEGIPIVDLGDTLKDAKPGDTVSTQVTVPGSHPNEDWHGKQMTVEITVSSVRKREVPELTDELAEQMGFDSMGEMRSYFRGRMQSQMETESQQKMRDQIQEYLLESTELDVPEGVANRHAARVLQRRYLEMLRMGIPREKVDENMTALKAAATEQAQKDLKLQFILEKVAEQENLEVTEAEVNSRIAQMAAYYGRRPERLRQELAQDGTLEQLAVSMLQEKALDALLSKAKVKEVPAESDQKDKKE
ncbi:MAG: trigger factor [Phycisphaerae bacterium]